MMNKTLLLNATYEPIKTIAWQKAISLAYLKKVEVLATYDRKIRSARRSHSLPAVVRLTRRVGWRKLCTKFNRQNVFARDRNTCQYCQRVFPARELTLDHVLPRSRGGPTNWTNIVSSCFKCNQKKADKTPAKAGMTLMRKPYSPNGSQLFIPRKQGKDACDLWRPYLWC